MECDCFETLSLLYCPSSIQTELFLRSTYVDRVWSPDGLQVQYRADDNATTLPLMEGVFVELLRPILIIQS